MTRLRITGRTRAAIAIVQMHADDELVAQQWCDAADLPGAMAAAAVSMFVAQVLARSALTGVCVKGTVEL